MKLSSVINVAVFNAVAIVLAFLVAQDQAWRLSYWRSMGFTPSTTYYPLFYVTSATDGSTSIPGTLTVDWLQVILLVLVVVDLLSLYGYVRQRGLSEKMPEMTGGQ